MRWLVDLPVSMTAIDAQQTFAAEARTTAMGRQHHFMPSDSGLSAPLRLACSHGLLLAQNQTLGIDSSGVHDDCYRAETGSLGRKCALLKTLHSRHLLANRRWFCYANW